MEYGIINNSNRGMDVKNLPPYKVTIQAPSFLTKPPQRWGLATQKPVSPLSFLERQFYE
jgi:hypothetical protein